MVGVGVGVVVGVGVEVEVVVEVEVEVVVEVEVGVEVEVVVEVGVEVVMSALDQTGICSTCDGRGSLRPVGAEHYQQTCYTCKGTGRIPTPDLVNIKEKKQTKSPAEPKQHGGTYDNDTPDSPPQERCGYCHQPKEDHPVNYHSYRPEVPDSPPPLQQLLSGLKQITSGDEEKDHVKADALLLAYINNREVEEAYDAIKKWYS